MPGKGGCDVCNGNPRRWLGPVGWLLGADLAASLQQIVLAMVTPRRFDLRDWMYATVCDQRTSHDENQPFWFDYIADSGDGGAATYSIAYLCLKDLHAWSSQKPREGYPPLEFMPNSELDAEGMPRASVLPRGRFLFVGGDTAYHVADCDTLAKRFKLPFNQAHLDISTVKMKRGDADAEAFAKDRRPLLGIPGNHDYYDHLNGFSQQFLKISDNSGLSDEEKKKQSRLDIAGFERVQTASYTAVKLPFGWWLWGIDAESRDKCEVDRRQRAFFLSPQAGCNQAADGRAELPKKLIVATASPTTVFGRKPRASEPVVEPFRQLGMLPLYLHDQKVPPLGNGVCRLDISGDVHHYARYGGPAPESLGPPDDVEADSQMPADGNYASVVSGIGGAFLHPSHTDLREIQAQRRYPTAEKSRAAIADKLFRDFAVWRRGNVPFIGMFMAIIFLLGSHHFHWETKSTAPQVAAQPGQTPAAPAQAAAKLEVNASSKTERIEQRVYTWAALSHIASFLSGNNAAHASEPRAEFMEVLTWPKHVALFLYGVAWLVVWLLLAVRLPKQLKRIKWLGFDRESRWYYFPSSAMAIIGFGGFLVAYSEANQASRGLAVDIVIGTLLLGLAFALSFAFPFWVGNRRNTPLAKVISILIGILHFVMQAFFPLAFIKIVQNVGYWSLAAVPIVAIGWYSMYAIHRRSKISSLNWIALIVIWLSMVVALLLPGRFLARNLDADGKLTVALILWGGVFVAIGLSAIRRKNRGIPIQIPAASAEKPPIKWSLILAGSVIGLAVIGFLLWKYGPYQHAKMDITNQFTPWSEDSCRVLADVLLAGIAGMTSVVWFTFYLAVCDLLNAHNNEVGGAARIEAYKQFIRFKVAKNALTGYVIGIKDVEDCGCRLQPFLIDTFTLRPKVAP